MELRFPIGFEVDTQLTGEEVIDIIENEFGPKLLKNVTSLEHGDDLDAFLTALVEMRNFLLSYASKVRIQADPNIHLIVGERLVVQGLSDAKIVVGEESAQDHLVIEVLAVEGQNAEGIIIEGSIAAAQDTIKQDIYRLRSDGLITERVGSVELENERYKLEYTINESLKLLHELDELAHEAHLAVDNAEAILDVFQEALIQLDLLQIQMRKLNEGITQGNAQSVGEQLIISLLLNGLFKNLAAANEEQTETPIETLENLDIEAMRSSLVNIADQIANVQEIDVQAIIYQIEHLRDSLPQMEDEDIGKSIRLINTYLAGQVIPGERVQILVEGEPLDEKVMEPIIREGLDNPYVNTYSVSAGMVNPDARSEILRLLQEIRATIAGIMAVIFTIGILILDHATIFSTLKWVLGNRRRIFTWIFGAIVGSVILTLVYILSGAEIPYVSIPVVIILGLMIGFIVVVMAEKFSPVDRNEIMAGQALGLSNVQIMSDIVIHASRPGLMNLLNRWKQQF